ncbi:MAG: peptidylprolyl isomerase, partial [Deltaproteobacteria bacterium]|nr:peptidylprolyl isomerase [Deltaproteobacteria bacterium]
MRDKIAILLSLSVVSLWLAGQALGESYSDRVVAVVNGDVILESDVQRHKQPFLRGLTSLNLGVIPPGKWPTERELLEELIIIQLLDQEAAKKGLKLDERAVESSIDSLKKRNNLTHDRFVLFLGTNGLNYGEFRDLWKRQLRLKGLINQEVTSKVPVSEKDAEQYFKENRYKIDQKHKEMMESLAPPEPPPEKFEPDVPTHEERYQGGEVRLRMITLKIPSEEGRKGLDQARKKAEKISQELLNGASFGDLAKRYSDDPLAQKGGDLGYVATKDMVPQLQQVVQRMKVGQVLGPVQSREGVLFFYLDDAKNRKTTKVPIPENVRKKAIEEQKKQFEKRLAERKERSRTHEPE